MTQIVNKKLLEQAAHYFHAARKNIYAGAALLYQIEITNAWEGSYSSFSEYVEQECQISRGAASKLLQAWRFYVIENGVSHAKLADIDAEKLYLAIKLASGSVDDRLVKAREWSRDDLRKELSTRDEVDCQHPPECRVTFCNKCHSRIL